MSMAKGHEPTYAPIEDMDGLRTILEQKMEEYNENVSSMDLVLFNQAMEHITRICRIIYLPAGNGLLVGVGGSGKQSLSKLASFILEYNIFRITVATNYSLADLKEDMKVLFQKTGVTGD